MSKRTSKSQPDGVAESRPEISFETQLAELEEIVRQLEEGEKSLDESLVLYERGVTALKSCHEVLNKAEQRIRLLVKGAGGAPELQDAPEGMLSDPAGGESGAGKPAKPSSAKGAGAKGSAAAQEEPLFGGG